MGYAQTFLDASSMNVTKYEAPPKDLTLIGPHTSDYTNSSIFAFLSWQPLINETLRCLPYMQCSQKLSSWDFKQEEYFCQQEF